MQINGNHHNSQEKCVRQKISHQPQIATRKFTQNFGCLCLRNINFAWVKTQPWKICSCWLCHIIIISAAFIPTEAFHFGGRHQYPRPFRDMIYYTIRIYEIQRIRLMRMKNIYICTDFLTLWRRAVCVFASDSKIGWMFSSDDPHQIDQFNIRYIRRSFAG